MLFVLVSRVGIFQYNTPSLHCMKTILIIEDNEAIRENTVELLEMMGFDVVSAIDGQDGFKKVQQNKPDLIFCDILMPQLDGYGLLSMLQADETQRMVPFYFLTAKSEPFDRHKAMAMGATGYITKPFGEEELLSCLSRHFEVNVT